jgi:phospholipase/carboxylesterase
MKGGTMKGVYSYLVASLFIGIAGVLLPQSVYAQDESPEVVVYTSSDSVQPGDYFTLRVTLVEDITETFDFYFLADTPYGVYTVFFDGRYTKGIQALYRGVPGYSAIYEATVWNGVRVPSNISGAFTFYAVAVRSGEAGEVTSLSDLAADNDYVISHDTESTTIFSGGAGPTPVPPVNSSGRSGDFYLPADYAQRTLPLLVAFHGTGGSGEGMVNAFQDLADEYGFIIVAPDSRETPGGILATWYITEAGYESDDYPFIMEWVDYIRDFPGVTIDDDHVMTLGFSGGCPVAPYIATNDEQFTHFASMHGEVWEPSIGDNLALAWLSTGEDDEYWKPLTFQGYETMLTGKGFTVTRKVYPGGHTLSGQEKRDAIDWWLGP